MTLGAKSIAQQAVQREPLYVSDSELIELLNVPEKTMREALRALDLMGGRHSGFPQKNKLMGNRRHWPSVKTYFERQEANKVVSSPQRRRGHAE